MRVTFLGSGHGVPEPERKCSSVLIEAGGGKYLFDIGCDAVWELAKLGDTPESVRALFISHPHGDHCNGLVSFCDIISWYYTKAAPRLFLPNDRVKKALNSWMAGFSDTEAAFSKLDVSTEKDGVLFDDGVMRVTATANLHCEDSRSFFIEAEGKTVLYTGDLKRPSEDFPAFDGADLLICEGAHFPVSEYEPILRERNFSQVVVTHIGTSIGISNIDAVKNLKKALAPLPVRLAHDGLEIGL